MKAFLGSMTGRVFLTLFFGTVISAILAEVLVEEQQYRWFQDYRDNQALERSEQLIHSTEIVPASARSAYLLSANRPGIRLEQAPEQPALAVAPSMFTAALAARLGKPYQLHTVAQPPAACTVPRLQYSLFWPT
ncbi:MAG: two-component sensor histidine kinase, partial [Telluria sp.]